MKVLFISPNSPFLSVGGVERSIKNQIKYCGEFQTSSIFLLPALEDENQTMVVNGVKIITKDFLSLSQKDKQGLSQINSMQRISRVKSKRFFKFLVKLIKTENIDLVLAENFHLGLPPAFSLMLNLACELAKIPVVLRVHSYSSRPIQEEIVNNLFWKGLICVSRSVAGDTYNKGADINHLTTKYLGVDVEEFEFQDKNWLKNRLGLLPEENIILTASRLVMGTKEILKEKGLLCLIEAFSKIHHRYPNLKLVIAAGKPPVVLNNEFQFAMEKLMGFVKLYGVEGKVICEPFSLEDMPKVYSGAQIFVLPSENETFGQVYIESMASGVPVIGTNVGGIPEIIRNNESGLLVPPGNPDQLASAIERLLKSDKNSVSLVTNAHERVEKMFSLNKLNDDLFTYFASLVL